LVKTFEGRGLFEDLGVDEKMISQWTLKKYGGRR
jgi:hypothetical protein